MALVGLSIVLASLSFFLCRSDALSTLSRLWPTQPKKKKNLSHSKGTPVSLGGLSNFPDVTQGDTETSPGSPKVIIEPTVEDSASDLAGAESRASDMAPDRANSSHVETTSQQKPPSSPSNPIPRTSDAQLMPPPPRPSPKSTARPQPRSTNSLRVPTTGPLPNRGPPQASSTSRPTMLNPTPASASTLPPSSRPRKKVLLEPGHSPLDWANLTRTSTQQQLSGVPYLQRVTPSQLKSATGRKGKPAWSSYKGRVYNIGPYLPFHPGGEAELMRAAGRDGQALFEEVHAWVNWENMMGSCLVGFLVAEEEAQGEDDMEGVD